MVIADQIDPDDAIVDELCLGIGKWVDEGQKTIDRARESDEESDDHESEDDLAA